jgi:hypothetical protein
MIAGQSGEECSRLLTDLSWRPHLTRKSCGDALTGTHLRYTGSPPDSGGGLGTTTDLRVPRATPPAGTLAVTPGGQPRRDCPAARRRQDVRDAVKLPAVTRAATPGVPCGGKGSPHRAPTPPHEIATSDGRGADWDGLVTVRQPGASLGKGRTVPYVSGDVDARSERCRGCQTVRLLAPNQAPRHTRPCGSRPFVFRWFRE